MSGEIIWAAQSEQQHFDDPLFADQPLGTDGLSDVGRPGEVHGFDNGFKQPTGKEDSFDVFCAPNDNVFQANISQEGVESLTQQDFVSSAQTEGSHGEDGASRSTSSSFEKRRERRRLRRSKDRDELVENAKSAAVLGSRDDGDKEASPPKTNAGSRGSNDDNISSNLEPASIRSSEIKASESISTEAAEKRRARRKFRSSRARSKSPTNDGTSDGSSLEETNTPESHSTSPLGSMPNAFHEDPKTPQASVNSNQSPPSATQKILASPRKVEMELVVGFENQDLEDILSPLLSKGSIPEVANEDDVDMLFPSEACDVSDSLADLKPPPPQPPDDSINDAAWDPNASEVVNDALKESMDRHRMNFAAADSQALLHLEAITSEYGACNDEVAASATLMSQRDRLALYNSREGFGVGDESSVDESGSTKSEGEASDASGVYEEIGNLQSDLEDEEDRENGTENELNREQFSHFAMVGYEEDSRSDPSDNPELPSFQPHLDGSRVRWKCNPDAISDVDDESALLSTKSGTTGVESSVVGLNFVESSSKVGSTSTNGATDELRGLPQRKSAQMLKIPPPPPEKLLKWEESKGVLYQLDSFPQPPEVELDPECSPTPHYKIHVPKSPRKKHSGSLTDELDLPSHKRMAEKIVFASSKAAKKFDQEYHEHSHGRQASHSSVDRMFCSDEGLPSADASPSTQEASPIAANGELLRGAFSPWKIPEEESSLASSSRLLYDGDVYASAAAKAVRAMAADQSIAREDALNESFEISLGSDPATEGKLADVLQWLFEDVLLQGSTIATAFSAFDIKTSTTVQADRLRAIANDFESFNVICKYVATNVTKHHLKCDKSFASEGDLSMDDSSISSFDSSQVTDSTLSAAKESSFSDKAASRIFKGKTRRVEAFQIPTNESSAKPNGVVMAANFVGFIQQISLITDEPSPFGTSNKFLDSIVQELTSKNVARERKSMQELIFPDEAMVISIFLFLRRVCRDDVDDSRLYLTSINEDTGDNIQDENAPRQSPSIVISASLSDKDKSTTTVRRANKIKTLLLKRRTENLFTTNLNFVVPKQSPSPFETATWNDPTIVKYILSFLGNPVSVCFMKRLNVFCNRVVTENQHVLMRDAVRLGGLSKFLRPSFWLWVTERCKPLDSIPPVPSPRGLESSSYPQVSPSASRCFVKLKNKGGEGKWQHIIERDVVRSFGNMPPHKTGAKYKQDSIVKALVSFGRNDMILRSNKGYQTTMDKLPENAEAKHFRHSSRLDHNDDLSNGSSETPTGTVSDWGGISPVGSMVSEDPSEDVKSLRVISYEDGILDERPPLKLNASQHTAKSELSDPVLSGNALTSDMKVDLQNKLRSILHALAARHEGVGYCQGMDYIVAHLLRVLQDTILLRAVKRMPDNLSNDQLRSRMDDLNTHTVVVEEVVFGVMDTLFSSYSLQHMYWPELRCLKTCCRVFEELIKLKLPVLADHMEHHDLNVGLFALGWFQTLFLYLPSMPSTTVCHMWDIWLIERSFKIFFRVGTAILFLSQPTLLNHDLEGMMTYLNTFPDATLLRRDILIPCALQIKITNRMLVEIEMEIVHEAEQAR